MSQEEVMVFAKITKEEIINLPLCQYEGEIIIIDTPEKVEIYLKDLEQYSLIGFDTEKKPAFSKGEYYPPSWLQLASDKRVLIIRLRKTLEKEIISFLENPAIKKIGVAIRDDIKELQTLSSFEPGGFIDLGDIARTLGIENYGLRNLAGRILNVRISKKEQRSNWGREHLTPEQKMYAAIDAWASLKIYEKLKMRGYLDAVEGL